MDVLVDAQLTLERLARDVDVQRALFKPYETSIESRLDKAETYVNEVIKDWEKSGSRIKEGASRAVTDNLDNLQGFLGAAKGDTGMKHDVSEQLAEAARLIQALRLQVEPADLDAQRNREG